MTWNRGDNYTLLFIIFFGALTQIVQSLAKHLCHLFSIDMKNDKAEKALTEMALWKPNKIHFQGKKNMYKRHTIACCYEKECNKRS